MLNDVVPESDRPRARWPESPTALGSAVRRVAPQLRDLGVIVDYGKKLAAAIGPQAAASHSARLSPPG